MELPEKLLLLLCFMSGYQALPMDMTGKAFIFPEESNTAYVKVTPTMPKLLAAVTVCVRFLSDYKKELALFSMATPNHADAFTIFKGEGTYRVYVQDQGATFWGLPNKPTAWNSVCVTWDGTTGLTQVWVNGKPSAVKGLQRGKFISGVPNIVLGQDQDTYGGGFDKFDSFYGHLKDVYMWDSIISRCQIEKYNEMEKSPYLPTSNVITWKTLEYTKHGYVEVQTEEPSICKDMVAVG